MRLSTSITVLAAAALAVPAIASAGPAPARGVLQTPALMLDKGDKPAKSTKQEAEKTDEEKRKDALRVIAEAADRVVSPEGIPSLLDMVGLTDRERLEKDFKKKDAKQAADKLAAPAKQFGLVWREKYKEGFDATDNFDQLKGMKVELQNMNNKEYAIIYFPAFGGWKPFEMHLTKSGTSTWRIQLPDKVDGEKLAGDLAHDVAKLCADKDHWYGDKFMDYNSATTQLVHAMSFQSDEVAGQHAK